MRPYNFVNFLWLFKKNLQFHKGSFKSYLKYIHKGFTCNYRKTVNKKELKILKDEWKKFRAYMKIGLD